MRAMSLTARLLSVLMVAFAVCLSAPAQSQVQVFGTVKLVRTGWNTDSFGVVISGPLTNPANCPIVDGYLSEAVQPGYETYLNAALAAYKTGGIVTLVIATSGGVQGRPKLIGINQMPSPKPERRTVVLRVSRWEENNTIRSFSDTPVIGTFTGHGTDCSHGVAAPASTSPPSGPGVFATPGWGQIEGDGHSGNDSCVSWVRRFAFDFDVQPFTSVEGRKQLEQVVLRYNENEAPACFALVFTQGGLLFDHMRCWTNGHGDPVAKLEGCLFLRVPSVDWGTLPNNRPKPLLGVTFRKIGPGGRWDVTDLFRLRMEPQFEPPPELGGSAPRGWGFALVGAFTDTNQLDARDNTRCTSLITDIALEVTFLVIPPDGGPPEVIH